MSRKKIIQLSVVTVILALMIWVVWSNTALELNTYTVATDRLPAAFDGYRIAQISDLHNAKMGKGNHKLLSMLKAAKPDMIALTGDLIDSRRTDIKTALQFAREAVKIAPCYYVPGNHEARVSEYEVLKEELTALGVTVLETAQTEVILDGARISVIGVCDPSFYADYLFGDSASVLHSQLQSVEREDAFTVLLSHRPELMDIYAENGIDLVLSGHAHGGQFRLPFIGGLVAPNQGLFPTYDGGKYTEGTTQMIVSRGIGNSIIPLRFNNRPELVLIELNTP